jgi:hypothetical protein
VAFLVVSVLRVSAGLVMKIDMLAEEHGLMLMISWVLGRWVRFMNCFDTEVLVEASMFSLSLPSPVSFLLLRERPLY